jgi:8-oxo-dGTP pyrophosphatase MutT (NUDIX family)
VSRRVQKVTAFITRPGSAGLDLLLFRHPEAGIQIPAGTVEEGEALQSAVLREAAEETGLHGLRVVAYVGSIQITLPEDERRIHRHFFHLACDGSTLERWDQDADGHTFNCFWAPMHNLPEIVSPQDEWLPYVQELGYHF